MCDDSVHVRTSILGSIRNTPIRLIGRYHLRERSLYHPADAYPSGRYGCDMQMRVFVCETVTRVPTLPHLQFCPQGIITVSSGPAPSNARVGA